MRLIDADELKEIAHEMIQEDPEAFNGGYAYNAVTVDEIDEALTIEAVPVVHGKIIYKNGSIPPHCSVCNTMIHADSKYCRECGAKLKVGAE